jgi:hypothetical protein
MPASVKKCQREITRPFTHKSNEATASNIVGVCRPVVCNMWGATAGVPEYSGANYAEKLQSIDPVPKTLCFERETRRHFKLRRDDG